MGVNIAERLRGTQHVEASRKIERWGVALAKVRDMRVQRTADSVRVILHLADRLSTTGSMVLVGAFMGGSSHLHAGSRRPAELARTLHLSAVKEEQLLAASVSSGFNKALEIGLYCSQRRDLSQAAEFDRMVAKLESGKVEEVRSRLDGWGGILKEQAGTQERLQLRERNSLTDALVPTGGLSLTRDYDEHRARAENQQDSHHDE